MITTKMKFLCLILLIIKYVHCQEPLLGEIKIFSGTFAPRGYSFCDGRTLSISGNDALYSIIGNTYGGDGRTTFNLPDLSGRAPVHFGQVSGTSLPTVRIGEKYGNAFTRLIQTKEIFGLPDEQCLSTTNQITQTSSGQYYHNPIIGMNYVIAIVGTYPSRY